MISQRYHVYSLVAVFLALTIGVLLGISIGGGSSGSRDAIARQSQAIARLNQQFKEYSTRLAAKQEGLDHAVQHLREADALIGAFLPNLLAGKLAGRTAAIVQIGSDDDTLAAVRQSLHSAGAKAASLTRINADFAFSDPAAVARAAASVPFEFQDPAKQPHDQLWGYIATVLAGGRSGKPFAELARSNLIRSSGEYAVGNKYMVVVVPADFEPSRFDTIVKPLMAKAAAAGMVCCVAATLKPEAKLDDSAFSQLSVPAVTHASWAVGQLSLIHLLAKGSGRYGFAPGDRLFPENLSGL